MEEKPLMIKKFDSPKAKNSNIKLIAGVVIVVLLGVGSGYLLSSKNVSQKQLLSSEQVSSEDIKQGLEVGMTDEKTFKDSTEGDLEKGGIDGEGSHHLVRPGGEAQNVYLTSSVVDLDKFVGHKVKVWGETFSAQKAGWLMDVGKLKVLQ